MNAPARMNASPALHEQTPCANYDPSQVIRHLDRSKGPILHRPRPTTGGRSRPFSFHLFMVRMSRQLVPPPCMTMLAHWPSISTARRSSLTLLPRLALNAYTLTAKKYRDWNLERGA